jgi:hypothetical protein
MTAVELATCRVPADPVSPTPVGGYVVACTTFFKRGFGVPSHRFLCLLLQFYGLELHHLTPLGILHVAAFVTLHEAYMGVEPHFDLWNYFFRNPLRQGLDTEAVVWSSVDIFIQSGPRVDSYFHLSMSDPPVGWWKVWFFLKNDAVTPLPVFTSSHPIPQPKWGFGVAYQCICKLQPLRDVVLQLLGSGLMGVDLLWTFVSHRLQPLR